jgi:hypothetical protein
MSASAPPTDQFSALIQGPREFFKDSVQLINRCTKPDRKGKCFEGVGPLGDVAVVERVRVPERNGGHFFRDAPAKAKPVFL